MSSPYPRTYYKGYSREQDEKLAHELFYGTSTPVDSDRYRYPLADSPPERRALEALCRLLSDGCRDLEPAILAALCCALDPSSGSERRLVFKGRKKRGRPRDFAADSQVDMHVLGLCTMGWKNEAAVKHAMKKFGLSRGAVFKARKRMRSWLKSSSAI